MIKRAFDIAVAGIMLGLAVPLVLILLVATRIESRGNPIFSQTRVGRRGNYFQCYKIRTMIASSPEVPSHEISDLSITRVGRILRKTKLDELPQLWNVIRGEMSLIGPRPCLPSQTVLIKARCGLGVLEIRPGISGLAQVRGIDMSRPEELAVVDQEYMKKQTMGLDLKIIWRTLFRSPKCDV